ncbi:sensor histidine kinase [Kitasatospora viridis]|nr:histidine kinase [Kitasatospora viridis]
MVRGIRPLVSGTTYAGALFAVLGAMASIPAAIVAMVAALAVVRSAAEPVQAAVALLIWAALLGVGGLARTSRRVLVGVSRRLLRLDLPDPVGANPGQTSESAFQVDGAPLPSVRLRGADRWRTPLWVLLHVALGWVLVSLGSLLVLAAIVLPACFLVGGVKLDWFDRTIQVSGGWQGLWTVLPAMLLLLLTAGLCAAVTAALRALAPRLLGPSAAERLALAAEREMVLAGRNRLAQELHDSIGHTLTAATIQAAVAGEVLAEDPVSARAAMRSIEETTRAALEDLDYVLGVLREENAATAPTRSLADLPELLDRLRHAGAVVEPELSGERELAQVPGTLSRAAYRILQEGLTNALRHGNGGLIRVRVLAAPDGLELSVANENAAAAPPVAGRAPSSGGFTSSGRGLAGLAERVRLLHGEFEAGPDGARGWRLAVRLPNRVSA